MENLEFSLKLQEVPVKITESDGAVKDYTLRELDGQERDRFLDDFGNRVKYSGTEVQGLNKYEGLQAGLLALCLRDERKELVKVEVIQKYPASVLSALFKAAQTLSKLTMTDKELADLKNG